MSLFWHFLSNNGSLSLCVIPLYQSITLLRIAQSRSHLLKLLYSIVAVMPATLIIVASALLSFTAAAPVQESIRSGSLEARQAPNCNIGIQANDAAAYDSSCWDTLGIMPYLTNWKATTPTCTDAESSAGQTLSCCVASEPWSTCFLRLATKQSNAYDCTQLAQTTCSFPATLDPALDPTIASQVNYVVLNIMMINNFFAGYYKGQLFPKYSKRSSSADHRPSSPNCIDSRRSKPEIEPDESGRGRKYTESDGGIDPRFSIP